MEKLERRVGSLEGEQQQKQLTVKAVIVRTFFDTNGNRREETLPCTYNEAEPFPETAEGRLSIRHLWPLEYQEFASPYAAARRMDRGDEGQATDTASVDGA